MAPSIIHAHHNDRIHPAFLKRECDCQGKRSFPQPGSDRVSRDHGFSHVPNRARIVKHLKCAVPIFDGIVDDPVSPDGIEFVLVPAPESAAVSKYETLVKRSASSDQAAHDVVNDHLFPACPRITEFPPMAIIAEIASQRARAGAQLVVCVEIMQVDRALQSMMKTDI